MFRYRRGVMRLLLLAAVILAGASFALRSEPAAAAPGPELITVVCVNEHTGILRYITEQPCQGHEQTIEIPADLPFVLCMNKYTKVARMSGVPVGCQKHEIPKNIPAPEETLGCASEYTDLIRIVDSHAQCQPHEIEVFFLALTDAFDDSYDTVGNVMIDVPAADGILANDKGTNLSIVAVQNPTANGGAVGVGPDGDFVYNPPIGFLGVDTFNYSIQGADGNVDNATVTINVNGPMIWFVDNSAPAGGDGSVRNPFDSLAPVNNTPFDVDFPGDVIFLYHGDSDVTPYNAQMDLEPNQQFIGQARELASEAGFTAPPFSVLPVVDTVPTLTSPGYGVWLEAGSKVAGMSIMNTAGVGIVGSTITGDVAIDTVRVTTTPAGFACIALAQVDGNVSGTNLRLNNCGGSGLETLNSAGTHNYTGALVIGSVAEDGVRIVNNSALITFEELNVYGANRGLFVQNSAGGSVLINGDGETAGSGGTIQNTLAQPVLMENADSVTMQYMNITAGIDPAGNGQPAIVATNNSAAIVVNSTVSGGDGTTGGGGTAMFCDASICYASGSSVILGGTAGLGAAGMPGGPAIHAINNSSVQVAEGVRIRGGSGADHVANPGLGADGILAQNSSVSASGSLITGGSGGVGGVNADGGAAVDVDVVGGANFVNLFANTLQGGPNGGGGPVDGLFVGITGGSVCVDASGNFTTGMIRLFNGGGTLGITQANIGDLSIANDFASVSVIGVISYNC